MKAKVAELSPGLVAIKGAAAPSPDMPGRAGGPTPIAAVPPSAAEGAPAAAPAPAAVAKQARPARRAAPKPDEANEANLAPLNFRIAASFRREFKTYAATHDLKLNELLRLCFEAYRRQRRD